MLTSYRRCSHRTGMWPGWTSRRATLRSVLSSPAVGSHDKGHVRFAEEGGATKAAAAISAAAVTINEVAPVLRVLEGAEEVAYWEEVAKDRSAAKKRRQGNSGGGGRGGGRGRGGRGRGRGGRGGAGGKRQGGPQGGTAKAART